MPSHVVKEFTHSVFSCAGDCECQYPAAIAQLAARRSHNPKVVSSILTGGIFDHGFDSFSNT